MPISSKQAIAGAVGVLAALALLAPNALALEPLPSGVMRDVPTGVASPRVAPLFAGSSLDYQGGPVMTSNHTHVIFWNPGGLLTWDPGYQDSITSFFQNVAADSHKATNLYAVAGQYTDSFGGRAFYDSSFVGPPIEDTNPAPPLDQQCTLPAPPPTSTGPTLPNGNPWPLCLTNAQLATEIASVVRANNLPTGLHDIYFLVTPDGFGSCFDNTTDPNNCSLGGLGTSGSAVSGSFCGFHSAIGPPTDTYPFPNQILYANIPYDALVGHCQSANPRPNASTADPTISTVSHEQNEAITDPLPSPATQAWINADGNEEADLCQGNFGLALNGSNGPNAYNEVIGSGHYFLQEEWSNDDNACIAREENDELSFSSSAPKPAGTPINFAGGASDPDGSILSVALNFGDGSPTVPTATTSHTYARDGIYQVTMTATDITGEQSSLTKAVIVDAPPTANFTSSPTNPLARHAVRFDAASSRDSDGSIVSYHWTFGDGSSASGAQARHTYKHGGRFTTVLTVTDNLGVASSHSRAVTVAPMPHLSTSLKHRSVRIAVNEAGTIKVGSTRKRLSRAGSVTIKLRLSAGQLRRLSSGHAIKVKLKITFIPRVGPEVTKKITVTVR